MKKYDTVHQHAMEIVNEKTAEIKKKHAHRI